MKENNGDQLYVQENIPEIIHLGTVVSTNLHLRDRCEETPLTEGSVVWADYQTAGRGQQGNHWESEMAKNLTFSVLLYPDVIPANQQFLISQIAALSIKKMLDKYTADIRIKWPNDIYWRDKKIAGMLIENDLTGYAIYRSIIGIGINVNQELFHSKAPNPVSLLQICGKKYHRADLLDEFLHYFYGYYLLLLQEKQEEIQTAYFKALYRNDDFYRYEDENGVFEAVIQEVMPTGHLLLQRRDGSISRYAFKELHFLL
ncbi:biotin--[acetyl-CoA-carboxylase] ligase [Parabacteroides sp. OttesenSCG-928-N08]|nr:biotin--[acetyl-CoA-carboxylase] ligase [Parabacteroides sp. OttesenSCG-928-N08]